MDDDIDIEEHDLLDNPVIRKIFPDLSILKKEIPGIFDDASLIKREPDTLPVNETFVKEIENDDSCLNSPYVESEVLLNENKQIPVVGNKIILGSRPAQQPKNKLCDNNVKDPHSAIISLNNIDSYLSKSGRFCKICLTLFPYKKDYEIHETTKHKESVTCKATDLKNKITIGSNSKKFKCDECNDTFTQNSLLRRHQINVHRTKHKNDLHGCNETLHHQSSPNKNTVTTSKLHQCFHCKVMFSSNRLLIEHIYMVLQAKKRKENPDPKTNKPERHKQGSSQLTKRMINKKTIRNMNVIEKIKMNNQKRKESIASVRRKRIEHFQRKVKNLKRNILVFKCCYCTYNFLSMKFCLQHLANKHKDSSIKEIKAVKFNKKCKYCSKINNSWKIYNSHLQNRHKEKIEKTIKIYPKICLHRVDQKCINSLSKQEVHNESLEMDLYEPLDNEQPEENKESNLGNHNEILLQSILFKCKRCDIHFLTVKSVMNHAEHMELLINWKCLLCFKIFKKVDENMHLKQHYFCNSFVVLELTESQLTRILYKCSKCAIHFDATSYPPHFKQCEIAVAESVYCKVCDILIDKCIGESHQTCHSRKKLKPTDFTIINSDIIETESFHKTVVKKKQSFDSQIYFKLCYCKTCNSFITKKGKHSVHLESRCAHLPTHVCKFCGLTFTNKTLGTHKIIHKQKKGLKLHDYSFYDLKNGKHISPPIPKYPKCKNCHVHFISRVAIINHLCSEDFLTCHLCNIKLSEPVFKLHMSFHYYSKKKNTKKYVIPEAKQGSLPSHPLPKENAIIEPGSSVELIELREPESNHLNEVLEENQGVGSELINVDNPKNEYSRVGPKELSNNCKLAPTTTVPINLNQNYTRKRLWKSDFALFNVLYRCKNCCTTIDTYDAVVEHCQDHLSSIDIEKIGCETCKLKLDRKSFENHKEFHVLEATRKSCQILEFDVFYFTAGIRIWTKHVFQHLDEEKSIRILNRSIYKYGVRMKMKVIQEGSTDVTVYKCNSCNVIVDPDSLSKHVENSCFKSRKHPCSHCGLPFMSLMSLKKHVDIHKKMNITLKSYRIVIINQEKDKKIDKIMNESKKYFILYKCRSCCGVMDKYQRLSHTLCNNEDLKTCSVCDLLVHSNEYKSHLNKHEWLSNYVSRNMKIILFGHGGSNQLNENPINQTTFNGIIVDFTFVQCINCRVCLEKSPISTLNHHTCYEESAITKCIKCELYILKNKLARHNKLHEVNVHFVKDNMNVIAYDPNEQLKKFVPAVLSQSNDPECDRSNICSVREAQHTKNNNTQVVNVLEKTTKLLKCSCGLHFLDKTSINEHFGHCDAKISKQNCSKCNLLFTPTVLFNHLLLHHGDKKYVYKYNIIEITDKKNRIITLYMCVNCKTHFIEHVTALEHFEDCFNNEAECEECPKCKLLVSKCSFEQHETLHHEENVADIEIVDIGEVKDENKNEMGQNEMHDKSIDHLIEDADFVRETKYNISKETLSQINLNAYNNTIYKCEQCNTHFLTEHTFRKHFAHDKHLMPPQDKCNLCDLNFSLQSLTKHIYIHHKQMKLNSSDFIIQSR